MPNAVEAAKKIAVNSGKMLLKIKKAPQTERLKLRILCLRVERLDLDIFVAEHVLEHVFDTAFERECR